MLKNFVRYNHLLFFIFLLPFFFAGAQNTAKTQQQFERALQFYKMQDYENSIAEIEKILKKTPDYVDAILLQADVYNEMKATGLEIEALENALFYSQRALIFYRLGKANFSAGIYERALFNFEKYLQEKGIPDARKTEVEQFILSCRFAIDAIKNPVEFNPERLSENINTANDEYWPSVSLDGGRLVFTRLIKTVGQLPQEDFFIAESGSEGWGKAMPVNDINTPENEGAQALSADGRLLFFTACNRPGGHGSCDIYYSFFNGKNWSAPKNAGNVINSSNWDAQPTISSDNRFLYFSSNRDGGKGKKDIWRAEIVAISENGTIKWNQPVNAGNVINTKGDEISPFIHPNNKSFYFASDFHPGMGGMDLFLSQIQSDESFSQPKNLGFPINTQNDEQGLNISFDGKTAFYASERNPGFGLDIYSFELPESIRPEPVSYVKAKITDAESGEVIKAVVDLINLSADTTNRRTETADENGEILLCLPLNSNYAFNVSANGYLFYSQAFQFKEVKTIKAPENIEIGLNRIEIGAEMNLYNIYFETDSFRILPDSEPELEKLVLFLRNNPQLEVEIQGHTDNTGRTEHNLSLSELRAKSVVEYLEINKIERSRLQFRGFGETRPVATNETAEGKMLNRRTTVKIEKQKEK
jgi:outer membrane protein OmpA-like peptidoglycan-associated protein/tetratricopeptide (TPR) repeat protein